TSSQRATARFASAVRELAAEDAERIEDRLGAFGAYGKRGDDDDDNEDLKLMSELFLLGARYRVSDSHEINKDAGEIRVDESVILKTLKEMHGYLPRESRRALDAIYGRGETSAAVEEDRGERIFASQRIGYALLLNEAQSRAVRLYAADVNAYPRVFCILSPPGSGKTTVAAAMAAEAARGNAHRMYQPQLLLSVQNVAVDNMGAALKKMDYGGGTIYNMKTTKKLDPHCPAPFDFLDLMDEETLEQWKTHQISLERKVCVNRDEVEQRKKKGVTIDLEYEMKNMSYEECLTCDRRSFENQLRPKIILSTVEMMLQKMYTNSKLCDVIREVRRVIIDEVSLLTEAALYAVIRRFPNARIVLIGDDNQFPPFMYDCKILGQELAGRPALSVAMKAEKVPVVELKEVYRAPQSLVEPYNRLPYGGRLVSKKAEGESPLSAIGLVHSGLPQLLLIDVDGRQERNEKTMSLYNEKEIKALQRLLSKFPEEWKDEIMIICLYKEQKRRLQSAIDKDFRVLTVDSSQVKEKPIVILMTTRTEIPKAGTFFDSIERCNVSVSRQQKALIILGKANLL
ncbi:hypothetical protein PMAYCL1PPCAC_19626, partial [Pristionchus mayeri]